MLTEFKLYKNDRGRFVSFELVEDRSHYSTYLIGRGGQHSFISFVHVKNFDAFVEKLKLKEADETELALAALYRSNDFLNLDMREE